MQSGIVCCLGYSTHKQGEEEDFYLPV